MSLDPGGPALVSTWPDEIGSDDLVQATSSAQPYYVASSADFNSKPIVQPPTTGRHWMRVTFGVSMGSTWEVVIVGRLYAGSMLIDGSASFGRIGNVGGTTGDWLISQGAVIQGGSPDGNLHVFRCTFKSGSNDEFFVDEVSTLGPGDAGTDALTGITVFDTFGLSAGQGTEIAFVGLAADGVLSAGNRSDIKSFAQSHYGTP
jgi:hypothetical protein